MFETDNIDFIGLYLGYEPVKGGAYLGYGPVNEFISRIWTCKNDVFFCKRILKESIAQFDHAAVPPSQSSDLVLKVSSGGIKFWSKKRAIGGSMLCSMRTSLSVVIQSMDLWPRVLFFSTSVR